MFPAPVVVLSASTSPHPEDFVLVGGTSLRASGYSSITLHDGITGQMQKVLASAHEFSSYSYSPQPKAFPGIRRIKSLLVWTWLSVADSFGFLLIIPEIWYCDRRYVSSQTRSSYIMSSTRSTAGALPDLIDIIHFNVFKINLPPTLIGKSVILRSPPPGQDGIQ